MKIDKTIIVFVLIFTLLIALSAVSPDFFKGVKTGSVVTAVSTINYQSNTGEVRDGQLYGSKMIFNAKITNTPLEVLYPFAGKEQIWNNYKVIPEYNIFIKISAKPRAEYTLSEKRESYYQPTIGNIYQETYMGGSNGYIRIPLHVEVYADEKALPTTLVLSKDIPDFGGQDFFSLDNKINLQKASIAQVGALLPKPASDFVVTTAPQFIDFQNTGLNDYKSGRTYIFDASDYNSKIKNFYSNYGSRTLLWVNDPQLALWAGYDKYTPLGLSPCSGISGLKYSNKGYCKLTYWDGLYKVNQVEINAVYNPTTQLVTVEPIQFASDVVLEIPSETIKSFAVLRGVGVPEVTYTITDEIIQGDRLTLIVNVKNKGDNDGFSIVPTSKSGRLIYTPPSYTSEYISSGSTKEFKFIITVAGKETSETEAIESNNLRVRAEHNPTPINLDFNTKITYKYETETGDKPNSPSATVKPSSADTMDESVGGSVTISKWYENTWFYIGLIILILSIFYFYYSLKR